LEYQGCEVVRGGTFYCLGPVVRVGKPSIAVEILSNMDLVAFPVLLNKPLSISSLQWQLVEWPSSLATIIVGWRSRWCLAVEEGLKTHVVVELVCKYQY
jgi:hypothetical protein